MPRDPIADNRCEFAGLKRKTAVFPWRNPKCILIQADLSAIIRWIKPTVDSGLREKINVRAKLRVDKKRQTRIEKSVDAAVDQTGRGLFEMVNFQIEGAAQSCAKIIVKSRKC